MKFRTLVTSLVSLAMAVSLEAPAARIATDAEYTPAEPAEAPIRPGRPAVVVSGSSSAGTTTVLHFPGGNFDTGVLDLPLEVDQHPRCYQTVLPPRRLANEWATPADYDGDGHFDVSTVRANGDWSIDYASDLGFAAFEEVYAWGDAPARFVPLPADYDGDCRADRGAKDVAGNWYIDLAANGFGAWDEIHSGFGGPDYVPVPADYDGDGAVDLSTKGPDGAWRIDYAVDGRGEAQWDATYAGFGGPEYAPVPADYDGDGQADFSTKDDGGTWRIDYTRDGRGEAEWDATYLGYGGPEYAPVPADYDGDGAADFSTRDASDHWYIDWSSNGRGEANWDAIYRGFGGLEHLAVPADYDGDGSTDLASHTADGRWLIDFAVDGFGAWDLGWNSFVSIGARAPTAEDIAEFDTTWMNSRALASATGHAEWTLSARFGAGVWQNSERMIAMARMFELTRDRKYLDHLHDLLARAIRYRDDNHPAGRPYDAIRRASGLPAWGGSSIGSAGLHHVDETVSNLYAHALATFARIVFDDPSLHGQYGSDAIEYANAALETIWVFLPQVRQRRVGRHTEAYLVQHPRIANTWTAADCDAAHAKELAAWEAEPTGGPNDEQRERMEQQETNCRNSTLFAGHPIAHNENHAFGMALIELTRAIESPFYRTSDDEFGSASWSRVLFPLYVARIQRYFVNHLQQTYDVPSAGSAFNPESFRYRWHHVDDLPAGASTHYDDASHASLSMQYIGLLNRDLSRLSTATSEPIALRPQQRRLFANTFLAMTDRGNLEDSVAGTIGNPSSAENGSCDGWLSFTALESRTYDRCHEMVLRIRGGVQPSLGVGNQAALLANAGVRYPSPQRFDLNSAVNSR